MSNYLPCMLIYLFIVYSCGEKNNDGIAGIINHKKESMECAENYIEQEILKDVFNSKIYSATTLNEAMYKGEYVVNNSVVKKGENYTDLNGNTIKVVSREDAESGKLRNFIHIYKFKLEDNKVHLELNYYLHGGVVLKSKFEYNFNLERCEYNLEKMEQFEA